MSIINTILNFLQNLTFPQFVLYLFLLVGCFTVSYTLGYFCKTIYEYIESKRSVENGTHNDDKSQ